MVAILCHRLGTELPPDFASIPNGDPCPSGSAHEVLTAMEASKQKGLPDVHVFRYAVPPKVDEDNVAWQAGVLVSLTGIAVTASGERRRAANEEAHYLEERLRERRLFPEVYIGVANALHGLRHC